MSQVRTYRWTGQLGADVVETMTFPGGEPHAKLLVDPTQIEGNSFVIDARLSDFNGLGRVLVTNDLLRRWGAKRVSLFCPYLPGARQDRGGPLTARVYADIINAAKFDIVVAVDPHSDVMPALLNNLRIFGIESVFPVAKFPGPDKAVLVIPDAGAGKRVQAVADAHGYETIQALKHRDPKTGHLSAFTCEEVEPYWSDAIVVDDICDGGGTFLGLADKVAWRSGNQPKLHLWVSHGIFSKGPQVLEQHFTTVCTTDSFPVRQETKDYETNGFRLTRVPLRDLMVRALNYDPFGLERTG